MSIQCRNQKTDHLFPYTLRSCHDIVQKHVQEHNTLAREDRQRRVDIARGKIAFFDFCPDLVVSEIMSHLELRDCAHLAATENRLHHLVPQILLQRFQEFGANKTARLFLESELTLRESEAIIPKLRSMQELVDLISEYCFMPKVTLNHEGAFARFMENIKYTNLFSAFATMKFSMELGGDRPIPLSVNIAFINVVPSKEDVLELVRRHGIEETEVVRQKIERILQRLRELWKLVGNTRSCCRRKMNEIFAEIIEQKISSILEKHPSTICKIVRETLLSMLSRRLAGRDYTADLIDRMRATLNIAERVTEAESLIQSVQKEYENLFTIDVPDQASLSRFVHPQLISEYNEHAKKVLKWLQEDDTSGLRTQFRIVLIPLKLWVHLDDATSPLVKLSSGDRKMIKETMNLVCNSFFVPEELEGLPNTTVVVEKYKIHEEILAKLDETDRAAIL